MVHDLQQAKRQAAKGKTPYDEPLYLVFGHHPFDETTGDGDRDVYATSSRGWTAPPIRPRASSATMGRGRDGPRPAPRVLALVSAHTHAAKAAHHCVRKRRYLRELVVGSTINPPQEAALLTVGPDPDGQASVRLQTLPAVGREEAEDEAMVPAASCRALVGELQAAPDCRPLFKTDDALLGSDCQQLERRLTLRDRLTALARSRGPITPHGIEAGSRWCGRGTCSRASVGKAVGAARGGAG